MNPDRQRTAGFTLIEILVSIALLGIVMSFTAGVLTSFQVNSRSSQRLSITQAQSSWMEQVSNTWSKSTSFGNLTLLPAVPTVDSATWTLSACEVDPSSGAAQCGATVSAGQVQYNAGATTTTGQLVRLNLVYKPALGSAATTSFEVSRR